MAQCLTGVQCVSEKPGAAISALAGGRTVVELCQVGRGSKLDAQLTKIANMSQYLCWRNPLGDLLHLVLASSRVG